MSFILSAQLGSITHTHTNTHTHTHTHTLLRFTYWLPTVREHISQARRRSFSPKGPPFSPRTSSISQPWQKAARKDSLADRHLVYPGSLPFLLKEPRGASLVAQWLRVCLPMQGTRVRALVCEDPTCRGATRPVSHNY